MSNQLVHFGQPIAKLFAPIAVAVGLSGCVTMPHHVDKIGQTVAQSNQYLQTARRDQSLQLVQLDCTNKNLHAGCAYTLKALAGNYKNTDLNDPKANVPNYIASLVTIGKDITDPAAVDCEIKDDGAAFCAPVAQVAIQPIADTTPVATAPVVQPNDNTAPVSETPAAAQRAEQAAPQPEPLTAAPGTSYAIAGVNQAGMVDDARPDPIGDLLSRNIIGNATGNQVRKNNRTVNNNVAAAAAAPVAQSSISHVQNQVAVSALPKSQEDCCIAPANNFIAQNPISFGGLGLLGVFALLGAGVAREKKGAKFAKKKIVTPQENHQIPEREDAPKQAEIVTTQTTIGEKIVHHLWTHKSEIGASMAAGIAIKAVSVGFVAAAATATLPVWAAPLASAVILGIGIGAARGAIRAHFRKEDMWTHIKKSMLIGAVSGGVGFGIGEGIAHLWNHGMLGNIWQQLCHHGKVIEKPSAAQIAQIYHPAPVAPVHAPVQLAAVAAAPHVTTIGDIQLSDDQLKMLPENFQKLAGSTKAYDQVKVLKELSFHLLKEAPSDQNILLANKMLTSAHTLVSDNNLGNTVYGRMVNADLVGSFSGMVKTAMRHTTTALAQNGSLRPALG